MWKCQLDAIVYWEYKPDSDQVIAWHVDEGGHPTYQLTVMTLAESGGAATAQYGCQNCSLYWGLWSEVEDHLANDEKEDGQRGRWKHHGG